MKTSRIIIPVVAAIGFIAFTILTYVTVWRHACAAALIDFVYLLIGAATPEEVIWAPLAFAAVIAAPTALCCGALWYLFERRLIAALIALVTASSMTLIAALSCLLPVSQLLYYDAAARYSLLGAAVGGFGCVAVLWLYSKMEAAFPKLFNRETVSYIVFGGLTTVVSFVTQMLFAATGTPAWVNTIGSWICAVTFAYIVNKLFVFESRTETAKAFFRELWLFFAARLVSLGMELVFMYLTVDVFGLSESVCKLIAQVFILIANYVFSKLVIFRKKAE